MTILVLIVAVYIVWNIILERRMTANQMYKTLVKDQGKIGKVLASIFYSLAWCIKFVKCVFFVCKKKGYIR